MKKRIVVEVELDDYQALLFVKNLLGLEWKDLIIAGAVRWADAFHLDDKLNAIKEMLKNEKGGDGDV